MTQFTITTRADEIYTFTGDLLQEMNWGYAFVALSGYTKFYKTDANNLVIEIKRWVDEDHCAGTTAHECVVLNINEVVSRKDNVWFRRWIMGNSKDYISKQIDKKFPYYMYPSTVFDSILNTAMYHIGLYPDMVKQV